MSARRRVGVPALEAARLLLTWPTEAQLRGFYEAVRGADVFEQVLWDGPESARALLERWERVRAAGYPEADDPLLLGMVERASDRMVGTVSLRPQLRWPEVADVGYLVAPCAQGRGYATEAVGAVVDHAFARRRAERVYATTFVGNAASRRVLDKLGFVFEGTLRRTVQKRGAWRDQWLLAITRPDWEARRTDAAT